MGMEGAPQSPYESMSLEEMIADPVAGPIFEQKALEYLMETNKFFKDEYTGEMDEDGYLIKKDGTTGPKASQNISGGKVAMDVMERVRAELK